MRLLFAINGFVYFSCAIAFFECLCTGVSDQMDWSFFLVGSMSTCSCNKEALAAQGGAEGGKCARSHRGSLLAPLARCRQGAGRFAHAGKALLQVFFAVFVA